MNKDDWSDYISEAGIPTDLHDAFITVYEHWERVSEEYPSMTLKEYLERVWPVDIEGDTSTNVASPDRS